MPWHINKFEKQILFQFRTSFRYIYWAYPGTLKSEFNKGSTD